MAIPSALDQAGFFILFIRQYLPYIGEMWHCQTNYHYDILPENTKAYNDAGCVHTGRMMVKIQRIVIRQKRLQISAGVGFVDRD
jgi:hypothetical protein